MLVCYILVRHLPHTMNAGKAMAQVHHAGTKMTYDWEGHDDVLLWEKEANGFGTVITLEPVTTFESSLQIEELVGIAHKEGLVSGTVTDPTYPVDFELTAKVMTCGYILVDTETENLEVQDLLETLKENWRLHK